jgi:hypothetical protein
MILTEKTKTCWNIMKGPVIHIAVTALNLQRLRFPLNPPILHK